MGRIKSQLGESLTAFRAVFGNPGLRCVELAWSASIVGQWAYAVAVSVYAYGKGGTSAVGLVWFIRMVPAALVSPFTAMLADRFRRERVMLASDLVRVVLIAVAAVAVFVDAPPALVYGLTVVVAIAVTPFRPAEAAITPALARTPEELTAANVASSTIESVGFFLGPALAGLLLAVASTGVVFIVTGATVLWSAFFVSLIHTPRPKGEEPERAGIVTESLAGFRAISRDRALRTLVGLLTAQTLIAGALQVLVVVMAFRLLGIGKSGVGFLNSAFGVGALIGAFGALALVGRQRLSLPFMAGVVLWGVPVALIGAWPAAGFAVVMLGLVGIGNTLVDVAGFTLVQRTVADEVLARVFGVMQMLWLATIGIGALIAPALVSGLGVRGALVATGCLLPVLAVLLGPRLARIDSLAKAPTVEIHLLRAIPIFAPLPGVPLEHLAARLKPLRFEAGREIVRQGDPGDRFYVLAEGEVDVVQDGQKLAALGPGDYFGEIALLRDVPRTATVTARTLVVAYALERDDFLGAVTSHPPSASAAEIVIGKRLGSPAVQPANAGVGEVAP